MKDDTQDSGRRRRYFRYAVFSLAALLVVSLGFVLIPRDPEAPETPPYSEQARASAFSDTLSLRAAGLILEGTDGAASSGSQAAPVNRVVTLLTVQARALMLPSDAVSEAAVPVLPSTAPKTTPATTPPAATSPSTISLPSVAGFAEALHASAAQRLKDAETADGGIARLLAGAGISQLLAAEEMAAVAGISLAALPAAGRASSGTATPEIASPGLASPGLASPAAEESIGVPTASAGTTSPCVATPAAGVASAGSALASAAAAELELIYAYQAALVRLDAASVPPASDFLAQHRALGGEAEFQGGAACAALPIQPAGYSLSEAFLAAPAAALGTLEAGTLPVYGDLVALRVGPDRAWALSALQSAARRALYWGASPGPVPGLVLNEAELPQLRENVPSPGTPSTASR